MINLKNFIAPVIVSILLFLLLEPFGFMAPFYFMILLLVSVLVLGLLFVFAWKEKPKDEREEVHMHFADRIAYMAGAVVLLAGVLYGGFAHNINPWIVVALIVMVLSKAFALVFKNNKN